MFDLAILLAGARHVTGVTTAPATVATIARPVPATMWSGAPPPCTDLAVARVFAHHWLGAPRPRFRVFVLVGL